MEEYLTLEELAAELKLSRSNLRRLAAEGELPAVKVGRLWRFRRRQIEAWLQMQENQPRSVGAREELEHEQTAEGCGGGVHRRDRGGR